jgi:hypothetical protein
MLPGLCYWQLPFRPRVDEEPQRMFRGWVVLPVALLAVLAAQPRRPTPPDPVALAAATEAAGWTCTLPYHPPPAHEITAATTPIGESGFSPGRVADSTSPNPQQPAGSDPPSAGTQQPPDPGTGPQSAPHAQEPSGPNAAEPSTPSPAAPNTAEPSTPSPGQPSPGQPNIPVPGATPEPITPSPRAPSYPRPVAGLGTGSGQNPRAELTGTLGAAGDSDSFALPLRAGDVLGVTVRGGARELQLRDPRGTLVIRSETDRSASYPKSSPLPGGGAATLDHVAALTGTHVLTVTGGVGQYTASVLVFHASDAPQKFFLDFRGAAVDTGEFGIELAGGGQPRRLSGLAHFLPAWGLTSGDEPAVAERISRTFTAALLSTGARVQVGDSNSAPDAFGQPDVSRIVIGGTSEEAGINTIGISDSVDPGNFDRAETALVLLDALSAPAARVSSINHYLGPASNRVEFVGSVIGNIAAHEAGHLLGSWHTDPDDGMHNVMDSGDLAGAYGFGPDGIGGTADDTQPHYGPDTFAPDEGYQGTEDTLARTAIGLGALGPPRF